MPTRRGASPRSPATILDLAFERASKNIDRPLVRDQHAASEIEFVCRCSNQAGTRFLMACLVAKLSDPSLDIRKPYTEIGGAGIYSGRRYDETYVAPFAFRHNLPVNPTTSFLTPAFRTNKTTIEPGVEPVGKPKKLYATIVTLITAIHGGTLQAENVLAEILRWLTIIREERKQRIETLFASRRSRVRSTYRLAGGLKRQASESNAASYSLPRPVLPPTGNRKLLCRLCSLPPPTPSRRGL